MGKKELNKDLRNLTHGITEGQMDTIIEGIANLARGAVAAGEDFQIPGIGTITVKRIPDRKVRNPATGEMVDVPAHGRASMRLLPSIKKAAR